MEQNGQKLTILPDNAYVPLKPGEVYKPVVSPGQTIAEVSLRSITYGIILTLVFAFAATFIGFKTGNAIETAIPIAILAVFLGRNLHKRRNTILENVIIQSMGQAAGVVVAGAGFTIPALYINNLHPNLFHAFLACTSGGFLGILLLIPLRRYFVKEQHGLLPFPEAKATTEIIATGEQTESKAGFILLLSFGIGFVYEFLIETFRLWNKDLTSRKLFPGLYKQGFELRVESLSMTFGLGYLIGLKYAAIIAAGSLLGNLVIVPLIVHFGGDAVIHPGTVPISQMALSKVCATFVKPIGIGAIAIAGIMGIIKMTGIILSSLSLGFKGILKAKKGDSPERTDLDISPSNVMILELLVAVGIFLVFLLAFGAPLKTALVGMFIVLLIAFLFTPVAARAIAIVGINPVSGMTLITVIFASFLLINLVGLTGDFGQTLTILIGSAVCTALSMSGAFVTDLKIGYWLGATPRNQERLKFLAITIASAGVIGVIAILQSSYGFAVMGKDGHLVSNPELPAPQANLIAQVVKTFMSNEPQPWLLYGVGGLLALVLEMVKIPALAFALGLYLPMHINLAILFGGLSSYLIANSSRKKEMRKALKDQGILIASGLMAGAAISGIFSALLRIKDLGSPIRFLAIGEKFFFSESDKVKGILTLKSKKMPWFENEGMLVGAVIFLLLPLICYLIARKGARSEPGSKE